MRGTAYSPASRRLRLGWRSALAGALCLAAVAAPAWGRSETVLPYPAAQVWTEAVRFLRVDRGFTLREKDADTGYILFDVPEGGKKYKGALELTATTDPEGRSAARVWFSLPDLPRHYETLLADKLAQKVRDDLGPPAPAPKPGGGSAKGSRETSPPKDEAGGTDRGDEQASDGLPRPSTLKELPRP